jgi:hypothetical protein
MSPNIRELLRNQGLVVGDRIRSTDTRRAGRVARIRRDPVQGGWSVQVEPAVTRRGRRETFRTNHPGTHDFEIVE